MNAFEARCLKSVVLACALGLLTASIVAADQPKVKAASGDHGERKPVGTLPVLAPKVSLLPAPLKPLRMVAPDQSVLLGRSAFQAPGEGRDDVTIRKCEPEDGWIAWQSRGADQHSVVADPLFIDPEKDDYRLKPESPAFQLGFKAIPVERIGVYQSPLRASWPVAESRKRSK
jgi:hypothetical protein